LANLKKLFKKIEKHAEKQWQSGFEVGHNSGTIDGYSEGFEEGVEAERTRVQSVLKMQEDMAMDQGKGTDAVRYRQIAEFLAFIYDPEKAEKDYEQMMKDF
jgi:flagellar biosynthesis/type III secretory pathway protein FliH